MSAEENLSVCERYEDWIALAVGGDLDARRHAELLRHLDGCPRCRRASAALEETRAALRRSLVPPDGEAVFDLIRAGVHREIQARGRVLPFRSPGWRRALPALAVAATLVAAVGLYRLEWRPAPPPPVAPAPPPTTGTAPPPPTAVIAPPARLPPSAPSAPSAPPAVPPPPGEPSEIWLETGGPSPGTRWLDGKGAEAEGVWLRGEPSSEGVAWLGPPPPETPRKIYQDDNVVLYWLADSADEPKEKDDAQPTIL